MAPSPNEADQKLSRTALVIGSFFQTLSRRRPGIDAGIYGQALFATLAIAACGGIYALAVGAISI